MDGNVMTTWDQPALELLLASSEHSDTEFDADEFSLPLDLARAGLSSARAYNNSTSFRAQWSGVFQRPGPESPHKVRRVEKVIRARSHVLCHKCNTEFGLQELCKTCSPNLAQDARPTFSLAELQPTIASSSISRVEASRNTRSWLERLSPPPEAILVSQSLRVDLSSKPPTQQSRPQSPSGSFEHIHEKIPASRPPLRTRKSSGASIDSLSMSPVESATVMTPLLSATIEDPALSKFENPRVFRRTRHQVRFICEQCKTVFPTRRELNCPQCGHVRCDHCVRDP
jgi:hypothetical protein